MANSEKQVPNNFQFKRILQRICSMINFLGYSCILKCSSGCPMLILRLT